MPSAGLQSIWLNSYQSTYRIYLYSFLYLCFLWFLCFFLQCHHINVPQSWSAVVFRTSRNNRHWRIFSDAIYCTAMGPCLSITTVMCTEDIQKTWRKLPSWAAWDLPITSESGRTVASIMVILPIPPPAGGSHLGNYPLLGLNAPTHNPIVPICDHSSSEPNLQHKSDQTAFQQDSGQNNARIFHSI